MFTYDIAVNLTTDTQKQVKDILGKFAKEVNKNVITVQLDYDSNFGDLTKALDKVQRQCPELSIQVRYDFTEKILEQAKAKLTEMSKTADFHKVAADLEEAVYQYNKLGGEQGPKKKVEALVKEIAVLRNTLYDAGKRNFIPDDLDKQVYKIASSFSKAFDSAQPLKLVDTTQIEAQKKLIADYEAELARLQALGASSRKTTDLTAIRQQVEDIQALVNSKFQIVIDNKPALTSIQEVIDYLNTLPDEKTVRITGTNAVAEKMGKFVEEFKDITQQMRSLFGEDLLGNKGRSNLEAVVKEVKEIEEKRKGLTGSVKEMGRDLDQALNVTSDENLGEKLQKLVDQIKIAKKGLKKITLDIELSDESKTQLLKDLRTIRDLVEDISMPRTIFLDVVRTGFEEPGSDAQFESIKSKVASYGDFSFGLKGRTKQEVDEVRKALSDLVLEYKKYVEAGGQKPIEELTENKKALKKLTDEYKQYDVVVNNNRQNIELEEDALERLNMQLAEIAQKVAQDITAKINVEPILDPQEFADKVTYLLKGFVAKIQIESDGILSSTQVQNIGQKINGEETKTKGRKKAKTQSESQVLAELDTALENTIKLINDKTEAFEYEGKVVSDVIDKEVSKLGELDKELKKVAKDAVIDVDENGNIISSSTSGKTKGKATEKKKTRVKDQEAYDPNEAAHRAAEIEATILQQIENLPGQILTIERMYDSYGDLAEALIKAERIITDTNGELVKETGRLNVRYDKNNRVAFTSEMVSDDFTYNEKRLQTEQKLNLAIEKEREKIDQRIATQNEKVFNEEYKIRQALLKEDSKAAAERERVAKEEASIRQAILDKDSKAAREREQVANEERKIREGLINEDLKAAKQREQVANEERKIRQAIIDEDSRQAKEREQVAKEELKVREAIQKQEQAKELAQIANKGRYADLDTLEARISRNDLLMDQFNEKVQELRTSLSQAGTDDFLLKKFDKELQVTQKQIKNTEDDIREFGEEGAKALRGLVDDAKRLSKIEDIRKIIAKNPNFSSSTKDELQKQIDILQNVNLDMTASEFRKVDLEVKRIVNDARDAGETGFNWFDKWRAKLGSFTRYLATYVSFYRIIDIARQGVQTVNDLDAAITELRKVSNAPEERLVQSFQKSTESAKELGSTISDVIKVTSDWARLGYDVDAAEELARVTTLFTTVGDNMTADDASSYLISTLQGFQMGADEAEKIVDKYNEVANNFAIDTAGIGQALQRSAASFKAANTDLSQSIALVTTANAVVQNPEAVGTMFKTLSARIRGAKTELEDLGEEEDEFTKTTSKLRDLVKSLTGFDIMEDEDTYKDIYEILVGIGKEWQNLTDIEQASLGEALAGKRNANALYAVLNNIKTLEDAYATAEDSAGSAAKEQQNYMKSIQYSIDVFKASVQELWATLIDNGTVKTIIDFGTEVIGQLTEIADKLGPKGIIGVVSGLIALLASGKLTNPNNPIGQLLTNIPKAFKELKKTSSDGTLKALPKVLDAIPNKILKIGDTAEDVAAEIGEDWLSAQLNSNFELSTGEKWIATFKAIGSSIKSFLISPLGLATIAVTSFVVAIKATQKANEELRRSAQSLGQEYSSTTSDLDKYKEEIQNLQDTLNNNNTSYEEAKSAREKLLGIQDELIEKYGDEKIAIYDITDAIEGNIDALDRLTEREWQNARNKFNDQNLPGWDWMNRLTHGADDNIGVMLSEMEDAHREIIGTSGDFEEFSKVAERFGLDIISDEATTKLQVYAKDSYELRENLLRIQKYLKDNGASSGLLRDIGKQINDLDKLIDQYDSFYQQYVLNERIFNSDYEDEWLDWQKGYQEYQESVKEGNEQLSDSNKQALLTQFNELRNELKERVDNGEITDAYAQSILNSFRNVMPELQADFAEADLRTALFIEPEVDETKLEEATSQIIDKVEDEIEGSDYEKSVIGGGIKVETTEAVPIVPNLQNTKENVDSLVPSFEDVKDAVDDVDEAVLGVQRDTNETLAEIDRYEPKQQESPGTRLTDEGQKILDATKAFNDAQELLSMANKNNFNAATEEQQKAYEYLQNEAEYYGVSIQQLIDMLHEAQALDRGFMLGRKDKVANAYGKARGIDISSNTRQQDYDIITSATDKLTDADYETALQFTDNIWRSVEGKAKELIKDTDTNEQKAEKYRQVIAQVAEEWRRAEEAANEVGPVDFNQKLFSEQVNELDALQSAYENFRSNIENNETKINLDISEVDALREKFGDLEGFDELELVITSDTSGADEIQEAFDKLATEYANHKIELEGINEANKEMIRTQLEMEGITSESAENFTDVQYAIHNMAEAEELATNAGIDLTNITVDETGKLRLEGAQAPLTAQALAVLALQKQLAAGITFGEQGNIDQIMALAQAAGVGAQYLAMLARAKSLAAQVDAGNYGRQAELDALTANIENFDWQKDLNLNLTVDSTSAKNSGAKAGKEAGEAAKDAFDEELSKLKESYERGEITLAQYLAAYRALIDKYFDDTEKNAEDRAKALHDYLVEMKGYYDSAISGVTTLIDYRIKGVQKQKDAAIKALEEERDAALKVYDDQIKAIDKVIKEKNKQIKALEKEKKALEKQKKELDKQKEAIRKNSIEPLEKEKQAIADANAERERQLDLQKNLYELERAQNQRTQFIYKDGQMVYQSDPEAIRNARENVKKSEDEQKTAELDKQIKMYEEQITLIEQQQELLDQQIEAIDAAIEGIQEEIEALNEQKELLEEQRAEVEEFYNKLIEDTTKYFDDLIERLEETKSKWERLAEIDKIASAWNDVGQVMEMLGYSVDDVLNDVPGAFDAFEQAYIACLGNMNGQNEQYIRGLAEATGKSEEEIRAMMGQMEGLGDKTKGALEGADEALGNIGTAAGTASGNVNNYATAAGTAATNTQSLKQATEGVGEDIQAIGDATASLDGSSLEGLIAKFEELRMKISEIKIALGAVETGSNGEQSLGGMGSIAGAIESLNGMTLEGLIGQFTALNEVITSVVSALGGGGGEEPATNDGMGGTGAQSKGNMGQMSGGEEGGGSGLTGAIEAVKTAADQYIGADVDAEGGTAIGDFNALAESVDGVTSVIGGGGSGGNLTDKGYPDSKGESKTQSGLSGDGTLIGALQDVGTVSNEQIGGIATDRMNTFKESVEQAKLQVEGIVKGLDDIAKHEDVECTIKINIEVSGGLPTLSFGAFKATGTAMPWDGMNLESATYVAKYATGTAFPHFGGRAYVKGDWGVQKGGKSLVGELGQELVSNCDLVW